MLFRSFTSSSTHLFPQHRIRQELSEPFPQCDHVPSGNEEPGFSVEHCLTHSTDIVEHPELVAERLLKFASVVGRDRVLAGTDCGFAQGPFVRRVHPSIQWAKLQSLTAGAALASRALWRTAKPARPARKATKKTQKKAQRKGR